MGSAGIGGNTETLGPFINDALTTVAAHSIMRITSAGHFAPALADASANAGPVIGVTTGSVAPGGQGFVLRPSDAQTVKMDQVPVVGLPVYVSAVTAGNGSTVPALGLLPLFTVIENVSVGSAYAARVVPCSSLLATASLREYLNAETIVDLGGLPWEWDHKFEDFSFIKTSSTWPGAWADFNLSATAPISPSVVRIQGASGGAIVSQGGAGSEFPASGFGAIPWRLSARLAAPAVGANCCIYLACNQGVIGFGVFPGYSATKWVYASGTENPQSGQTPSTIVDLGNVSAAFVQCDIEGDGASHVRYRFNTGAWSAWIAETRTATTGVTFYALANTGAAMDLDWLYIARRVR